MGRAMSDKWVFDPRRYAGHTPGPWVSDHCVSGGRGQTRAIYHYPHEAHCVEVIESPTDDECILGNYTGSDSEAEANHRLITDAPYLLDEVVRLRAEIERLRAAATPSQHTDNLAAACQGLLGVVDALMPGIVHIAVQDYSAVNDAPLAAREAIDAWTRSRESMP